jgi:hypothetical protein
MRQLGHVAYLAIRNKYRVLITEPEGKGSVGIILK